MSDTLVSISSPRSRLALTLEMIKFPHTVFALPFALLSALIARGGLPTARETALILVAMAAARSAAMTFNRIADRRLDAMNPRTSLRALPAGSLSVGFAAAFTAAAAALLVVAAWLLNPLALKLSPLALLILFTYSYTKRFTWASHFALGLSLAGAPLGAWVALTGRIDLPPLLLALAVLLWTAGFDIIYACQDASFDRDHGLSSIPARFGVAPALKLSSLLHVGTVAVLFWLMPASPLGAVYAAGVVLAAALLVYEHRLVSPTDLSRVDEAFFTVNGLVSVAILFFGALDLALAGWRS